MPQDDGLLPLHLRPVPAQLPRRTPCKIALIGEAPGEREVARGQPFVGPSGSLLDAMLRTAEIVRDDCLVTNVYDTKLTDNDVSAHAKALGDQWQAFHEGNLGRLAGEISRASPNLLVALGGTALSALASVAGLQTHRGNARMGAGAFAGYKVFPTYHPAAILRQWSHYTVAIGDLVRAAQEAESPTLTYPRRALYITPTIEEVETFLSGPCRDTGLLSVDIETGWGQIRGVNFAPNTSEAMYVPFIWLSRTNRSYWATPEDEERAWVAVRECLQSPTPKVGQNFANYDVVWLLERAGIRVASLTHDLRLLHKSLYPELPANLQFMGSAYSRQGAWKHWGRGKKHGGSEEDKRDA